MPLYNLLHFHRVLLEALKQPRFYGHLLTHMNPIASVCLETVFVYYWG